MPLSFDHASSQKASRLGSLADGSNMKNGDGPKASPAVWEWVYRKIRTREGLLNLAATTP